MKKIFCFALILSVLLTTALCAACGEDKNSSDEALATIQNWQNTYTAGEFGIHSKSNPFVEITLDTEETIRLELYPTVAPRSVENFITYVREGFYEGVAFHRIIQGMMIQTGGFEVKEDAYVHKDPTHAAIKGEFYANGVNNTLAHTRGVISMARTSIKDSATSQFFICSAVYPSLDGQYAAFGRVIDLESMAVVDRLEKLETHDEIIYYGEQGVNSSDVPVARVTIKKAVVVQA